MTKQEIIDAFNVAQHLRQLVDLVASEEARAEMISAAETIIASVTDYDETYDIILQALNAETDTMQFRELTEENGRLKRELDAAYRKIDELSHLRRELEAANEREAKMMVRIAELTTEPVEEEPGGDDAEPKKKRASNGWHRWTDEEDAWIANHLNSATSRDVAEKFGVSPKAAYTRMLAVKERLGK